LFPISKSCFIAYFFTNCGIYADVNIVVHYVQYVTENLAEIKTLKTRLLTDETSLMNEATIWSRAIYPLLVLAEEGDVRAWSEVALAAQFVNTKLAGVVDGILATVIAGIVRRPYLVAVEGKRTLESKNPRIQFYGQLLVAAKLNWQKEPNEPIVIFGCYTIADIWTFARATIRGLDQESDGGKKPQMIVETSREYIERVEGETILKILKKIVAKGAES